MLSNEDIDQMKLIFMPRDECQDTQDSYSEKLEANSKTLVQIETKMNMLLGILTPIGVAVLGIAVKLLFGG